MSSESNNEYGSLKIGEYHPSAPSAMVYVKKFLSSPSAFFLQQALLAKAEEGCRISEICSETLSRIQKSTGVSDRYLLGLAWFLKEIEEDSRCDLS